MIEMMDIEEAPKVSHEVALPMAGPMGNAMAFLKAGGTMEQLRDMLALQKDFEAHEARKAYVEAMAAFKLNPPEIFKRKLVGYVNKDGSTTGYMHATLGDVTTAIINGLAMHGISHRWDTKQANGQIMVTCILTHKMGHSESTMLEGTPDNSGKKNSIQQMASTVTYLQRYTLLAASGLATKDLEDDDGRGSGEPEYDAEGTLQEWIDKAEAAVNLIALSETRKMAGAEFNAAKDVVSWNAFKVFVEQKRKALQGASA